VIDACIDAVGEAVVEAVTVAVAVVVVIAGKDILALRVSASVSVLVMGSIMWLLCEWSKV
jgi:hypothetical protein